jgi:hypothetical protein
MQNSIESRLKGDLKPGMTARALYRRLVRFAQRHTTQTRHFCDYKLILEHQKTCMLIHDELVFNCILPFGR